MRFVRIADARLRGREFQLDALDLRRDGRGAVSHGGIAFAKQRIQPQDAAIEPVALVDEPLEHFGQLAEALGAASALGGKRNLMPVRVGFGSGDPPMAMARRTSSQDASCVSRVVSFMLSEV